MIRILGLRKRFGAKQVLDGVDLDDPDRRDRGRARAQRHGEERSPEAHPRPYDAGRRLDQVDGEEIVGRRERELNAIRRRFGMLFQGAALFDSMTVGENVGARAA